jgi:hypothetical protein
VVRAGQRSGSSSPARAAPASAASSRAGGGDARHRLLAQTRRGAGRSTAAAMTPRGQRAHPRLFGWARCARVGAPCRLPASHACIARVVAASACGRSRSWRRWRWRCRAPPTCTTRRRPATPAAPSTASWCTATARATATRASRATSTHAPARRRAARPPGRRAGRSPRALSVPVRRADLGDRRPPGDRADRPAPAGAGRAPPRRRRRWSAATSTAARPRPRRRPSAAALSRGRPRSRRLAGSPRPGRASA